MTSPSKPTTSSRFEPGAKVRVRYGVTAPDFEDIPLGGWTGTIQGVEQTDDQITYEITWDERTLAGMHPVYRKRCQRDDCDVETMWLSDDDLEADDGTPVPIEQPTEIFTPPLSQKDQDDRVRMALGLTHDDPLPEISHDSLLAYHCYLSGHLKFPFNALCGEEEIDPFSRKRATVIVTGLLDPAEHILIEEDGLICTGRDRDEAIDFPLCEIEVKKKDPNFKLVSDYAYWFHNWPCRHESHTDREDFDQDVESESPPTSQWGFLKAVVVCGIAGGLLGATIGAALRALDGARPAALIGGLPLAVIGAFALGWYGSLFGAVNRARHGRLLGVALGLFSGGLLGVLAGLSIPALPWSLAGGIAGVLVGPNLVAQERRPLGSFLGTIAGTCGGILYLAYERDRERALAGVSYGVLIGMVVGSGLLPALIGSSHLLPRMSSESDEPDEDDGGDILPMKPRRRGR